MAVACIYKKICLEAKCISEAISGYGAVCNSDVVEQLRTPEHLFEFCNRKQFNHMKAELKCINE